jgi:hypothetical protein
MAKKTFKFDKLVQQAEQQNQQSLEYIRENIEIDEEFQKFIPPLLDDEYRQLEENIKAEGCRDALIVWEREGRYILIDGHNRYNICTTYNLPFRVQIERFDDAETAKDWMINNQLGKRNVTEETKAYLRGLQYKQEKRRIGGTGANQYNKAEGASPERTAERLAEQHKVSEKTIRSDEKFADAIDRLTEDNEQLKWDLLNKKLKFSKVQLVNMADNEYLPLLGQELVKGYSFSEALRKAKSAFATEHEKPVNNENKIPEESYQQLSGQLKTDILTMLDNAIVQKDVQALASVKKMLGKLEKLIGKSL